MSALKRKAATQLEKSSRDIDTDNVESSPMREASEGVLLSESPMQPSSLTDDCSTTLQETETELVGSNPDLIVEDAPSVGEPLIDEASKNDISMGAEGVEQVALSTKAGLQESNVRVAPKKIKHPSSAWMIFSHENREKIQKDQPSLTFTEVAKALAERYRSITPEEKERLELLAKADKERYAREVLHSKSFGSGSVEDMLGVLVQSSSADLVLPLARVRKILKMDTDVKNITKEAMVAITKSTELFVAYMSLRCATVAAQRGVRTVRDTDLVQTVHALDTLDFLRLDFPKIPKAPAATKDKRPSKVTPMSQPGAGGPGIRSFFGGAGVTASSSSASSSSFAAAPSTSSSSSSSLAVGGELMSDGASIGATTSSSSSSSSSSGSGVHPNSAVCVTEEGSSSDKDPKAGSSGSNSCDGDLTVSSALVTSIDEVAANKTKDDIQVTEQESELLPDR